MTGESTDIGWAILELMGHRKLAGHVTDDQSLVRIDVYVDDPDTTVEDVETMQPARPVATQWYGRAAIYCITASTKEMCLRLAQSHQPAPVGHWELPERTGDNDQEIDDAEELAEDLEQHREIYG